MKLLTEGRAKSTLTASENKFEVASKSKFKSKSKVPAAAADDIVSSLFACLQLEEPSSSPLGKYLPPYTAASPPAYFKLEKEDEDSGFETWCFLQDLNDIRKAVQDTWLEYSRGEISFFTASSITDAAFCLLRCADAEFTVSSPHESTDWNMLIQYLGLSWFTRNRAIWLCPSRDVKNTEPRTLDPKINVVELLCPVAFMCLLSYNRDAGEVCAAATRRKKGQKDAGPPKTSGLHDFHHFCCILFKLAPQVHEIAHTQTCEHLIIDEFVQGLAEIHRTGKTPMW